MTTETTEDGSSSVLKLEDVVYFENQHKGSEGCPICAYDQWWLMHTPEGIVSAVPWSKSDGETLMGGVSMVTFICRQCGYVKMHHLDTFKERVKELRDAKK